MKKKRNLKERILVREKRRKRKSKLKKLACLSTAALMAISMISPQLLAYATSKQSNDEILKTQVEYNEDYSKASIKFDVNSMDKEKYELISITSDKEGTVLYDENKREIAVYETIENGSYSFTVKYAEKQKEEIQAIEENVKETEIKTDIEDETSNVTEEIADESNQDAVSQSVEKQEEKVSENISENTIVQEEKIIVDVSEIKISSISEEAENDLTKNEVINSSNEFENQTILNNEAAQVGYNETPLSLENTSVNLEEMFDFSGTLSESEGKNQIDMTDSYYTLNNNSLILGKLDPIKINQTIFLKSKYKLDFNRDFEVSGKVKYGAGIDGFTVSFHNDGSYSSKNVAGSLGVYKDTTYPWASSKGLANAVVLEIDTYDNKGIYGDTTGNKHVAITETDSDGVVKNKTYKNKDNSEDINKFIDIYIKWNSKKNEMEFNYGKEQVVKNDFSNISNLKSKGAYISFSTAIYDGKSKVEYVFNDIKYTDIQPKITTTVNGAKKSHAIPGETVTVTHEIKNEKSTVELKDILNLSKMQIDNSGNDLTVSNIKMGTDLSSLQSYDGTFDKDNPLPVKYPANSGRYYVQYNVAIPDLKNYGSINQLNYQVLLGQKGMTQINSEGSLDIRNKPSLVSKINGEVKTGFDVLNINSANSERMKSELWKELYAKTAIGSETKLVAEEKNPSNSDLTVGWEYYVDSIKQEEFPVNIEKGKIYSISIRVTDSNDDRLTNTFKRYIVVSDNVETDGSNYLFANDLPDISETKLSTLNIEAFKKYVTDESKLVAIKIDNNGQATKLSTEINTSGWINGFDYADKEVGTHIIEVSIPNTTVKCNVNQTVLENTWSYDTPDRTEENGASGYIVIPKSIELENGSGRDKDKIVANEKIFFANYETEKSYFVYTDKQFKIRNKENGSEVEVTTSGNGNYDGIYETIGRLDLDRNELAFKLSASNSEVNKAKGRWEGNMTFRFELQ